MSANISFNDEQMTSRQSKNVKKTLPEKVVSWGIAKNKAQATNILYIVVAICFGITIFNVLNLSSSAPDVVEIEELPL